MSPKPDGLSGPPADSFSEFVGSLAPADARKLVLDSGLRSIAEQLLEPFATRRRIVIRNRQNSPRTWSDEQADQYRNLAIALHARGCPIDRLAEVACYALLLWFAVRLRQRAIRHRIARLRRIAVRIALAAGAALLGALLLVLTAMAEGAAGSSALALALPAVAVVSASVGLVVVRNEDAARRSGDRQMRTLRTVISALDRGKSNHLELAWRLEEIAAQEPDFPQVVLGLLRARKRWLGLTPTRSSAFHVSL